MVVIKMRTQIRHRMHAFDRLWRIREREIKPGQIMQFNFPTLVYCQGCDATST